MKFQTFKLSNILLMVKLNKNLNNPASDQWRIQAIHILIFDLLQVINRFRFENSESLNVQSLNIRQPKVGTKTKFILVPKLCKSLSQFLRGLLSFAFLAFSSVYSVSFQAQFSLVQPQSHRYYRSVSFTVTGFIFQFF